MALVKYNNNSLSSVTSAAGFPAGAMTLIKTVPPVTIVPGVVIADMLLLLYLTNAI